MRFWPWNKERGLRLEVDSACTVLIKYAPHLEEKAVDLMDALARSKEIGLGFVVVPKGIDLQVVHGISRVDHHCTLRPVPSAQE